MHNFFTLTRVFFLTGFNVNKAKKTQSSAFAFFGLALGIFVLASLGLSYGLIERQKAANLPIETVFGFLLMMAFMLNFVISVFQLQSIIFNTKDYELLESLPLTKPCILSAKLFATYLINVAEDLALILPTAGMYLGYGGSAATALLAVLSALFISFVPILLSAIIGSLSALISARSKHSNLINIISSILFFGAFFAAYMYINYTGASNINSIINNVFFLNWMDRGIKGEYLYMLYYILFNLGGAVLVTVMISLIYRPVNTWLKAGSVHVDYDKVKEKESSDLDLDLDKVLLKKEWHMVSKRPQYLINSILGGIFFLIISLVFLLLPTMFLAGEEELPKSFPYVMAMMVAPMGLFMNSIATTTSSSISFEGRYGYEMLRSYPIDPNAIIKAKLKVGLYIEIIENLIVSLILSVIMILKGFYEPYFLISVFLYPQLAGATLTITGMLTGLRWPKLDFENESQVLKNSAASNLLMLFIFLPSMLLFGIHLVFTILGREYVFLNYVSIATISLIYGIVLLILSLNLKKKGKDLFNRIILKH